MDKHIYAKVVKKANEACDNTTATEVNNWLDAAHKAMGLLDAPSGREGGFIKGILKGEVAELPIFKRAGKSKRQKKLPGSYMMIRQAVDDEILSLEMGKSHFLENMYKVKAYLKEHHPLVDSITDGDLNSVSSLVTGLMMYGPGFPTKGGTGTFYIKGYLTPVQ